MQATPLAQQVGPHGVLPEGQQQLVAGSEHVPAQQPLPQTAAPAWHRVISAMRPRQRNRFETGGSILAMSVG